MADIDAYSHVFPVAGGALSKDGRALIVTEIYGTAFAIGGGYWMTAGHVLRSAASQAIMGIGFMDGSEWSFTSCGPHEVQGLYDVGVFQVANVTGSALPWAGDELPMAAPVLSVGFPYALNLDLKTLSIRAFRGHIVAAASTCALPAKPRVYELQFQCPRGLSGAPLLFKSTRLLNVGMIVGNASTQMLVLSDKEILADGSTTIVERYEMLQLGIAIQAGALLPLRFDILGGKTLAEHLRSYNLV